jgi:hypothetical protein
MTAAKQAERAMAAAAAEGPGNGPPGRPQRRGGVICPARARPRRGPEVAGSKGLKWLRFFEFFKRRPGRGSRVNWGCVRGQEIGGWSVIPTARHAGRTGCGLSVDFDPVFL